METIIGAHVKFEFLKKVYTYELHKVEHARDDDEQVGLHKMYAMRSYLLYLVERVPLIWMSST